MKEPAPAHRSEVTQGNSGLAPPSQPIFGTYKEIEK